MSERAENLKKAWLNFISASPESSADALLDLFVNLDRLESEDSLSAGYAAFKELVEQDRFDEAGFVARALATNLGQAERFVEATEITEEALRNSLWMNEFEIGMLRYVAGRNYFGLGRLAEAELSLEMAVELLEGHADRFAGFASTELAEIRVELVNVEGAVQALAGAVSIFEGSAEVGPVGYAKRRLGEVFIDQQKLDLAKTHLEEAIAVLSFAEWTEERLAAELALGRLLLEMNHNAEAGAILTKVASSKEESRNLPLAAEALYYLKKIEDQLEDGIKDAVDLGKLEPVLTAAGLFDLAASLN